MLNMDFHRKLIIERNRQGWKPSPMSGAEVGAAMPTPVSVRLESVPVTRW